MALLLPAAMPTPLMRTSPQPPTRRFSAKIPPTLPSSKAKATSNRLPPPSSRATTIRISLLNMPAKMPSTNMPTRPRPRCRSTTSHPLPNPITCGLPATGHGALEATTGCPAFGARPPITALSGRLPTGATMAAAMASTAVTGAPTSASTVVSTTASATSASATSVAIGTAITSITTAVSPTLAASPTSTTARSSTTTSPTAAAPATP